METRKVTVSVSKEFVEQLLAFAKGRIECDREQCVPLTIDDFVADEIVKVANLVEEHCADVVVDNNPKMFI